MLSGKALLGTGHKNSQIEATASIVPDKVPFGTDRHLDAVVDRKRMWPQEIGSKMDGKKLERQKILRIWDNSIEHTSTNR